MNKFFKTYLRKCDNCRKYTKFGEYMSHTKECFKVLIDWAKKKND